VGLAFFSVEDERVGAGVERECEVTEGVEGGCVDACREVAASRRRTSRGGLAGAGFVAELGDVDAGGVGEGLWVKPRVSAWLRGVDQQDILWWWRSSWPGARFVTVLRLMMLSMRYGTRSMHGWATMTGSRWLSALTAPAV
jgi:hypothetical protein